MRKRRLEPEMHQTMKILRPSSEQRLQRATFFQSKEGFIMGNETSQPKIQAKVRRYCAVLGFFLFLLFSFCSFALTLFLAH